MTDIVFTTDIFYCIKKVTTELSPNTLQMFCFRSSLIKGNLWAGGTHWKWGTGMCSTEDSLFTPSWPFARPPPISAFFSSQDKTFTPKSQISPGKFQKKIKLQSFKISKEFYSKSQTGPKSNPNGYILLRNSVHLSPKFSSGWLLCSKNSCLQNAHFIIWSNGRSKSQIEIIIFMFFIIRWNWVLLKWQQSCYNLFM